jgi:AcrR family transcriptional regulator
MTAQEQPGTRDRILIAAATMLGEDPTVRLSVRAVAARAGVSTGSLRHFFPSQRQLIDEVAAGIAGLVADGDALADTSIPAQERLLICLQRVLAATGTGEQARHVWRTTVDAYVAVAPDSESTETYLALEQAGRHRMEQWLRALTDEGALAPGDDAQRARFLSAVLDGLSVGRALPADGPRLAAEEHVLRFAVAAVFATDAPPRDERARAGDAAL